MDECVEQGCGCPDEGLTCTSVSAQYADVSLPVKVRPSVIVGEAQTDCCGEPVVTVRHNSCCCGSSGCELIITQPICIRIPIQYGTTIEAGEPILNCKREPGSSCNQ